MLKKGTRTESEIWYMSPFFSKLVWEHRPDGLPVGAADDGLPAEIALPLGRLLRQDVALIGLLVDDFLFRRDLKPLFRSLVGF